MVSSVLIVFVTAIAFQAAPPQAANGFHPVANPDSTRTEAPKIISLELRGDIMMAKKMYREAIDMYKQGPETAILLNKTGIAYHQLQEMTSAKKYYERAIKLDRNYSEAINNLSTVFYAQKS